MALGAHIAVTSGSDDKLEACRTLGADILVNYTDTDFVAAVNDGTAGAGAHVILDNMGAAYLERNIAALAEGGRLVVIGLQGGWNSTVNLAKIMSKRASVHSTCLRTRPSDGPGSKGQITQDVITHVWPMISESLVRPVVHAVVPIEHAPNAHRMLDEPGTIGKVLLSVAGNHN